MQRLVGVLFDPFLGAIARLRGLFCHLPLFGGIYVE
jgi:hypothetical protein